MLEIDVVGGDIHFISLNEYILIHLPEKTLEIPKLKLVFSFNYIDNISDLSGNAEMVEERLRKLCNIADNPAKGV